VSCMNQRSAPTYHHGPRRLARGQLPDRMPKGTRLGWRCRGTPNGRLPAGQPRPDAVQLLCRTGLRCLQHRSESPPGGHRWQNKPEGDSAAVMFVRVSFINRNGAVGI
jgi:hypothetical protein